MTVSKKIVFSALRPLNSIPLSRSPSFSSANRSSMYITTLHQRPDTSPKLYKINTCRKLHKINIFRSFSFFYLVLRLNCMYIVIGKKLRDLKRRCYHHYEHLTMNQVKKYLQKRTFRDRNMKRNFHGCSCVFLHATELMRRKIRT